MLTLILTLVAVLIGLVLVLGIALYRVHEAVQILLSDNTLLQEKINNLLDNQQMPPETIKNRRTMWGN